MTLYDLADVMNVKVLWAREPGAGTCECFLQDIQMIARGNHVSVRGVGKTPYEAMNEFVTNIRGQRLIRLGAKLGTNSEFKVPDALESIGR